MKKPLHPALWALAIAASFSGCTYSRSDRPKTIIISSNRRAGNALVCLADKENAKHDHGKKWKVVTVTNGEQALNELINKKIDIAIVAPPSFFRLATQNPKAASSLKILAGINNIQNTFSIVSSRNANIQTAKDLKQKRLGHLGEYSEFFKNYFFLTEGINESQITQIDFDNVDELLKALDNGRIDAAIVSDETTKHIDRKKYTPFFSTVHEITSQVIVRQEALKSQAAELSSFLQSLISSEKELYIDTNQSLEKLKNCYPGAHEEILKDLLRRRELRVLLDESLRAQYAIYKKWLLSRPEFISQMPIIRGFDVQDFIDASILMKIDFRRVLIK